MSYLELKQVTAFYGAIQALKQIDLTVEEGEIVTLIGSNGAGKSTTLKTISGLVPVNEGTVLYKGKDITSRKAHQTTKLGVAHVPEGRRIFPKLTVKENLQIGAFGVKDKKLIDQRMEKVFGYFPRVKERLHQLGGTMSGGEQQMLAIGRALMMDPDLLMLDEPSMGLAPIIVEQIFHIIKELNDDGMTILLVEQNAFQALKVAHRGYVLQTGSIWRSGNGQTLLADPTITEAYLA
ncbi:ABC transporter ATP-binding protein [Terribacillus saccharophilus]|uniref:ABC transporter ATP-binding protein n=1 Tax=Terribacillus saccharophilus TaxID=361277 RepID=A0A268AF59_9BACI|nr:ABC transporter ATP-binding protein [Terribacillus saccharophilus]PAD22742.1 ABC transporter ATP-binding protein [Terribacillus saccharophilus]